MNHKVGDKVRIKPIVWCDINGNNSEDVTFADNISKHFGKEAVIKDINHNLYHNLYQVEVDNELIFCTDEMFEDKIEETMEIKKIVIPEGWEVEKVENGEIILKEVKKELPKTWEECYVKLFRGEFIDSSSNIVPLKLDTLAEMNFNALPVGFGKKMLALCQLLVNRNAYRDGWEPDYDNNDEKKYCIEIYRNEIVTNACSYYSRILSFQSIEVRDEFLKNFYDLIKEAKELI